MRKIVCGILAVATILVAGMAKSSRKPETYEIAGIVTELDSEADTVIVEDWRGNLWAFYGIEDWMLDDQAMLTLDDNATDEVEDDIITEVRYIG